MTSVKVSCLICATPRCGSTLLCEALRRSRLGGRPEEFFSIHLLAAYRKLWNVSADFSSYVQKAIEAGTSPNGVFSAKLMWSDAQEFFAQVSAHLGVAETDLSGMHEMLQEIFPDLHYVFIERKDTLAQAVSFSKALQTNVWVKRPAIQGAEDPDLKYDRRQIEYLMKEIAAHSVGWKGYFALTGISFKHVYYEDLRDGPEKTARDVLDHLGVAIPADTSFGRSFLQKQSDHVNQNWIARFRAGD